MSEKFESEDLDGEDLRTEDLTAMFRNGRVGRRGFLKAAMGLGLTLPAAGALLAACGGDDDSAEPAPPAEEPPAEPTPAEPAAPAEPVAPAAPAEVDLEGVTLKFAKAPHGEMEAELFEQWLAPFEEATGATVEHTIVPWEGREAAYTSNFASDDPFDVSYQTTAELTLYGTRGAIDDLRPRIEAPDYADEFAHFFPSAIDATFYQDALYGLPFVTDTIVMFINEDMLAEAGLEAPTTTDELVETSLALKDAGIAEWGFTTPTTVLDFGWYFNLHNAHNLGGDIVSDDLTAATINSPEVIQATQYATDLIEMGIAPPVGAFDREGGIELFKAAKLAFLLDEPLRIEPFNEEGLPFSWTIEMPVGAPGGGRTVFSTIGLWVITSSSDKKDAAWELVKFLSTAEFSSIVNTRYGFIPARDDVGVSGGAPLLQKNLEFAVCCWDGLRSTPWIGQILDEYVKALEVATSGSQSVEDALNTAQSNAEEIIAEAEA